MKNLENQVEQLTRRIERARQEERNALIAYGVVLGKRQAYEQMMADVQRQAAVEKQQADTEPPDDTERVNPTPKE